MHTPKSFPVHALRSEWFCLHLFEFSAMSAVERLGHAIRWQANHLGEPSESYSPEIQIALWYLETHGYSVRFNGQFVSNHVVPGLPTESDELPK